MKKWFTYVVSIFASFVIAGSAKAFFWVYPIPGYPTPDFVDQASAIVKSGAALGQSAQVAIKYGVDTANNLKSAAMSIYQGELSTLVQNGDSNVGQKTMSDCKYKCKTYKNTSSDDVYTLTKILFLQYPDKGILAEQTYDKYRDEFYRDNLMEIFAAANELQAKMEGDIKALIETSIECITGNGKKCDIPSGDDGNTDALFVEGKAYNAISNLYEVLLKVTTLKAQLAAVRAIKATEPAPYIVGVENQVGDTGENEEENVEKTEDEVAFLHTPVHYTIGRVNHIEKWAFAQVELNADSKSNIKSLSPKAAKQQIGDFVTFITPPESPVAHTYVKEEAQMAEMDKITDLTAIVDKAVDIHNTIYNLDGYKDTAESVKEAKEQHQRSLDALKKADACARQYLGRHFKDPDAVWGASKSNITNHDTRTGISGWAYNAYEVAKAAEVNVDDEDSAKEAIDSSDVVVLDIDINENSMAPTGDIEKDNQAGQDLIKSKASTPGKGKEEQALAENRKAHMLFWQIGAEASKMLASNPNSWGAPVSPRAFPIWQDVKSYYDAYLDNKYANIKAYLNSFEVTDVLAVVVESLKGKAKDASDSLYQKTLKNMNQEIEAKYAALDKQAKENTQKNFTTLSVLQKQRQDLVAQLNEASDAMQDASAEVSAIRSKAEDEAGKTMRDKVTSKAKFPTSMEGGISFEENKGEVIDIEQDSKKLSENISENKKRMGLELAQKNFSDKQKQVSVLENKLNELDEKIAEKTAEMQEQGGSEHEDYAAQKSKLAETMLGQENIDNIKNEYSQKVNANLRSLVAQYAEENEDLSLIMYSQLKSLAKNALNSLKQTVNAEITAAKQKFKAMGDDLYDPTNHDKVVKIHQQMIQNIKRKATIKLSQIDGMPSISSIHLFAKLLNADTSAEEEDYFVGNTPKERDLRAPKAIFANKLPPLREVFHFDSVDFNNVTPFGKKKKMPLSIIVDNFLNYGGEIPEVWKYMLRQHAFVEADIDLHKALNIGCETVAHYRGGVMPCRIKNSNMVLDVNNLGHLVMTLASGNYSECDLLELNGSKLYHPRRKTKNNKKVYLDVIMMPTRINENCKYSELGTLLDVQETGYITGTNIILDRIKRQTHQGTIKFRKEVFDAYYAVLEELNSDGGGFNKEKEGFLGQVEKIPLERNQIGEFLFYMENEKNMRQQMQEVEKEYNNMMEELFNKLRELGYDPSPDLDFSKEEDYNLVRNQLDNAKNETLQEAETQLSSIETKGFEVVEERVKMQQGIIDALQFDKDENTIIGDGLDENQDYETSIKSSKANRSASDKYKKTVQENTQAYKQAETPYCAVY